MPKEAIQYSETQKYLFGVKTVCVLENSVSHTEILFYIPPPNRNGKVCDSCGQPASFVLLTKDHLNQYFVALTCDNESPENYRKLLSMKQSA